MKFGFLVLAALTSCASPPDKIPAKPASAAQFASLSCAQISEAYRIRSAELTTHNSVQSRNSTEDALGVFLVGLPTGSMTEGSQRNWTEDRISTLKGEIIALDETKRQKRC